MATSYKIRLKRFNGLDYDTLNLSSENIIRNNGNTVEQEFNNIIPSSNGMLKNDNGIFNVATLGTDYTAVDDSLTSSTTKTYSINKQKDTFVPFDMLGIVIDGNSTPLGASAGQYVIVKNSTISGITDGLYTAAQTIPANTAINSTYLSGPISSGGLNSIVTNVYSLSAAANVTLSAYSCVIIASKICSFQFEITANAAINFYTSVVTGLPAPQELANIVGLNNDGTFSQFYVDTLDKPNAGHLRTRSQIPSGTVVRFTATYVL